ncbi:metallophosphoesterase family protein [Variovorax sp. J22R24]|uniref:metallophosphoesterase family protein n=1 Tax=Variovorax gracilis TaxID=3053502 RepID=UPI0025758A50|nr:metallophosphoesterase family protein [Variovorax sp. J22R24]MDM0107350.1 metallophosphoesterase family protein [Variovorax sp. J22R24]
MQRIGLISDTHGLLRPEALAFLQGCDHIVHGGDIGSQRILDDLAAIAPVSAVRGNNDAAPWAEAVPDTALIEVGGLRLYAIHDLADLRIDPAAEGVRVVVSGHSHRPLAQMRGDVLYINPGSAGPRRFRLPIAVAELLLDGATVTPRLVELTVA